MMMMKKWRLFPEWLADKSQLRRARVSCSGFDPATSRTESQLLRVRRPFWRMLKGSLPRHFLSLRQVTLSGQAWPEPQLADKNNNKLTLAQDAVLA